MRIAVLTIGSRGDIQPYIALAQRLQQAGHQPVMCTGALYESLVTGCGVPFAPIDDEMIRLVETDEGRAALEGGSKMGLVKKVQPMIRRMLDDAWTAARDAEAIIYHPKTLAGPHLMEKLHIPGIMALPLPLYTPTRAFPIPITPQNVRLGGFYNRWSYAALRLAVLPYAGTINNWRAQTLGLPPRSRFADERVRFDGSPVPVLYAYSRHVVPIPDDWPKHVHVTGYWFLDTEESWQPPATLVDFLNAGAPPVYVGFGSMTGRNAEEKTRIVIDALKRSGQRGIIATGWGGLKASDVPDTMLVIDQAPHNWLFPQMAAVVHHGGAGTTGAGLRAGKPTVICPFFGDQHFWGERVQRLGAGPRPIPQARLTAEALAAAIEKAVSDENMRRCAASLGESIRAEDGAAQALEVINEQIGAGAAVGQAQ